jgi:hypothetical protein
MLETLLALITAHLLADFPLQTAKMVKNKKDPFYFAGHIAIVTAMTVALTGSVDPKVWAVVAVTHAAMDFIKIRWLGDGVKGFLIDQSVHVAVIVAVAVWRPDTVAEGMIGTWATPVQTFAYQAMVLTSGVVLAVMAGGIVIGKLLDALAAQRDKASDDDRPADDKAADDKTKKDEEARGLPGGGEYIGWLERGLTLLFLLIGQPEGIGLMLAAKSVLRFSDRNARAHTEYVIIGTMLSFGWAIVTGVLARAALAHWS